METINNKTLEKLKYELVRDGVVTYETLEKAEELANVQNINIGQALINSGILSEDTLLKFLESKLHIPYVNLEDYNPDPKCFNYVAFADARRYRIIPLFKIEDVLTVAMADPLDLFAIDKIIETAECSIDPVIASEASIVKNSTRIILGTGPVTAHEVNEHISVDSYRKLVKQYEELINKVCK